MIKEENIFKKEVFNLRAAQASYKNAFDRPADRYIREIPRKPVKEKKENAFKAKSLDRYSVRVEI